MKLQLFSLLLLISLQSAFTQQQKDYSEAIDLIEVWLEAQKDFENLPGLSAILVQDQSVIWKGAVGQSNMENNLSADPKTLYSICSISKLFTSVAIMKLYDEGKLRLDDRIHEILPWFDLKQQYEESGPITIRNLLTHSSGLPRESNHNYWTFPDYPFPPSEAIKAELQNQETLYPSSTYFQYSNLGMTLLGMVIEEISGMDYEDYIQKNILEPLGLQDTRPFMPEDLYGEELSIGYSALTRDKERFKINFFNADGIAPAAGFTSNVTDLGKFASWQLRLRDTSIAEVIKPSTLKNMQIVHYTDPDWKTTWGLGFSVSQQNGKTVFGHGGSCPGYRSSLLIYPDEKMALSVMINSGGTNPSKYIRGIKGLFDKIGETKPQENSDIDLTKYKGYYSNQPWWSESYIGTWGDKLVEISLPSDNPTSGMTILKHVEGNIFRRVRDDKSLGETITFIEDEKGNIIHYVQHNNNYTKIDR